MLRHLTAQAVETTRYGAAGVDNRDFGRVLRWGEQLDIRIVRAGARTDDPDRSLEPGQVAGYLAKYATKDASSLRTLDHRLRPHLDRMARTCRELADRAWREDGNQSPCRLLAKWAHMLGFRGHFSSKSRRHSITLGRLRRRHRYQQFDRPDHHLAANRWMLLILKPGCWTTTTPPSSSVNGGTRAPGGPTPATKHSPSPQQHTRGSTTSGRRSNGGPNQDQNGDDHD